MNERAVLAQLADLSRRLAAVERDVAELIAHPGISTSKVPPVPKPQAAPTVPRRAKGKKDE